MDSQANPCKVIAKRTGAELPRARRENRNRTES